MNKRYNLISIAIIILILLPIVSATQISLRPAKIEVPNMVQSGYYEVEYILNVNTEELTLVEMKLDESPVNEWITFEPEETEFYVSATEPRVIKMIIEPPETVHVPVFGEGSIAVIFAFSEQTT